MPSCWSCTVIVERDQAICPFCGADQANPVAHVNPDLPQRLRPAELIREWAVVLVVVIGGIGSLGGMVWQSFGPVRASPETRSEVEAAKSLREIRGALSTYALSTQDAYPATLNALGERANLPIQAASSAGYRIEYVPQSSAKDVAAHGYLLLARPEKSGYRNLCVDESGNVHATEESRAARMQDPPF